MDMFKLMKSIQEHLKLMTRVKHSKVEIGEIWNWWCIDYCKSDRILNYNKGDYNLLETIIELYKNNNIK